MTEPTLISTLTQLFIGQQAIVEGLRDIIARVIRIEAELAALRAALPQGPDGAVQPQR